MSGGAGPNNGVAMMTAKISDFGMSIMMNRDQTHVTGMRNGTLSHMAPEV